MLAKKLFLEQLKAQSPSDIIYHGLLNFEQKVVVY